MRNNLLIVAPYTKGTPYVAEANGLCQSAAAFGYHVEPLAIPDQGHWTLNIELKPRAILEAYRRHDGPLLVLDADCRVLQPLDELVALLDRAEIAIKYRRELCFTALFNVGVMLLRQCEVVDRLLEAWAIRTEEYGRNHRMPDQASFAEVMLEFQHQVRICSLPLKFHVEPFDTGDVPEGERVIYHRKASRAAVQDADRVLSGHVTPSLEGRADAVTSLAAPREVVFGCLRPVPREEPTGVSFDGLRGDLDDFAEYARRSGVGQFWHLDVNEENYSQVSLDNHRIAAIRYFCQHLPEGSRLVLLDYDVFLQHPPAALYDGLLAHDVVVIGGDGTLPEAKVLGIRIGRRIAEEWLPRLEEQFRFLWRRLGPQEAIRQALADTLDAKEMAARVCRLPQEMLRDVPRANLRTPLLIHRREYTCCHRERFGGVSAPHFLQRAALRRSEEVLPG